MPNVVARTGFVGLIALFAFLAGISYERVGWHPLTVVYLATGVGLPLAGNLAGSLKRALWLAVIEQIDQRIANAKKKTHETQRTS